MASASQPEITRLLSAWRGGDEGALEELIPLVYQELRRLAHRYMRQERPDHTLQTTALVNEVYLRLVDCRQVEWRDRAHFFALSARLMRRVLVDMARSRRYRKRGGGRQRVTLDDALLGFTPGEGEDVLALDEALQSLAAVDTRQERVVELRFFGGLSVNETAEVLQVSRSTVLREWKMAKLWLLQDLKRADGYEV